MEVYISLMCALATSAAPPGLWPQVVNQQWTHSPNLRRTSTLVPNQSKCSYLFPEHSGPKMWFWLLITFQLLTLDLFGFTWPGLPTSASPAWHGRAPTTSKHSITWGPGGGWTKAMQWGSGISLSWRSGMTVENDGKWWEGRTCDMMLLDGMRLKWCDKTKPHKMWWDTLRWDEIRWHELYTLRWDMIRHDETRPDETWWDMMRHDETWWDMMRHGGDTWYIMIWHDKAWWGLMRPDYTWWNMMRCDETSWDMMRGLKMR